MNHSREPAVDPRTPTVGLVMPAHRPGPDLDRALAAVKALDPAPAETLVVVDGGDEAVTRTADAQSLDTLCIAAAGPAAARNAGVEHLRSDVVLFVDSDVVVPPDTIERVLDVFTDPSIDAMFGSYDEMPDDPHVVSRFRNLVHHWTHQHARREASTFWAGCGAVRRSAFHAVGGFDAVEYPDASIEDIELGVRLVSTGCRTVLEPSIQAKHLKRWTLASMIATDVSKRGIPWMRLMLANGSIGDDLNTTRAARVRVLWSSGLVGVIAALVAGRVRTRTGLATGAVVAFGVVVLDRDFLRFTRRLGGVGFAAQCAFLMWVHHVSAAVAAGWAIITWPWHRSRR